MPIETPHLLPTYRRTKISQAWAHPIGAEIISQTLSGLAQYEHIHLWFLGSNMNAKRSDDYGVLSIRYIGPRRSMMKGYWTVDVSAVPRTVVPKVKSLLLQEGLPRIRAWMEAERNPVWYAGWKNINISYSIASQCLSIAETGSA